jgi:uncharacterized RDD family membrane protein YckC
MGAVMAGPLPEAVARALVEHHVVERVASELLEAATPGSPHAEQVEQLVDRVLRSPAVERWIASGEASRLVATLADRAVQNDAFRRAIAELLSSPELRRAVSEQATTFGSETTAAFRRRAGRLDDSVERAVPRFLRRSQDGPLPHFGGLATRGVALVVDAAVAQVAFVLAAAASSLVVGLAGSLGQGRSAASVAGGGWLIVVAIYFGAFWSTTGQTPGMRLMRLRVRTSSGAPPSAPRSLVRLVGLILAIVPLFAGFLPVLVDRRRRALPDFVAGTVVVVEAADEDQKWNDSASGTDSSGRHRQGATAGR